MGREQKAATEKALGYFKGGDSVSIAAAKAGIHATTLIRAIRQALKIGGYK
jgi:transposase-like protein